MTNHRFVIFDLDGTLIDSSGGVIAATNYALEQAGLPTRSPDEIRRFIGYPLETMFADFTDHEYEPLRQLFQVKARETVVESTRVLPHVDEVLRGIRDSGFTMAIATTKIRIHIELILEKCQWQSLFAATVGGDEVKRVKPEPDAFQLALERLQAESAESIVVGDTINDIHAAHALGLTAVAVDSPYGGGEEIVAAEPEYRISSLKDLPRILARHFA